MKTTGFPRLPFVGILVQDANTKGFTAFFKQFPNVIAEGQNEQEAMRNLIATLQTVLECDSDESDVPTNHVIHKTVEFQLVG